MGSNILWNLENNKDDFNNYEDKEKAIKAYHLLRDYKTR
jgi:hypothetical protein